MPDPTILAFDTSAAHCAAALLSGGRIVADTHEEMVRGQGERLMAMLQEIMGTHGIVWDELDAIAVGTGPGNFTGIRIGVATARGLALGLDIPAIGITAFETMLGPNRLFDTGPLLVSIPSSRRGYDAVIRTFNCDGRGCAAREITIDEATEDASTGSFEFDLPKRTRVVGHEAAVLAARLGRGDESLQFEHVEIDRPAVAMALVSAAKLANETEFPRPAPLYIRPPDAAPARAVPPVA